MIQIKEVPALGTQWWFDLFDAPVSREKEITDRLVCCLTTFENNYSRFLETSFVGTLNTVGEVENPSQEFIALLQFGQRLYTKTKGVYNFVSAHRQVARGYGSDSTVRDSSADALSADPIADLVITDKRVVLSRGAVDFGGFGKGWLIDTVASLLQELGVQYFLINGGGDIYASTLPDGSPVTITVEHPTIEGRIIAKIPLAHQGFAASSTYKRRWKHAGKSHHHIIAQHDADTAAHIIAETALRADVFATVACAMPRAAVPQMLKDNNLEYLFVCEDKSICSEQFEQCLL